MESSVEACFAAGSMHELGGKRVEVKTATPRGSGPMPRTPLPGVPTGGSFVSFLPTGLFDA